MNEGQRLSVGRTKENGLAIDDPSISKYHASLMLDPQGILHVADTGQPWNICEWRTYRLWKSGGGFGA
jgi:pSer/pThr/pTyr-binding forkhead associated (FHA) protein